MGEILNDPHNLRRFVLAQAPVFEQVCSELRDGRKIGHWMWFIFPQIKGLGLSETAKHFAISSREEAVAYLNHSILGPRLRECARLVNFVDGLSAHQIFGGIDEMKFRSSMTLFVNATPENGVFVDALQRYFGGAPDAATIERM